VSPVSKVRTMRPDEIEPDEHTEAIREAIQDQRRQQQ
jgi:hypothetical protein